MRLLVFKLPQASSYQSVQAAGVVAATGAPAALTLLGHDLGGNLLHLHAKDGREPGHGLLDHEIAQPGFCPGLVVRQDQLRELLPLDGDAGLLLLPEEHEPHHAPDQLVFLLDRERRADYLTRIVGFRGLELRV